MRVTETWYQSTFIDLKLKQEPVRCDTQLPWFMSGEIDVDGMEV